MGLIYCATFENGKKYIGQTRNDLSQRISEHLSQARTHPDCVFHKAIAKYGESSITWSVLEDNLEPELLNEREQYWINEFDTFYKNGKGYNMTLGGGDYQHMLLIDAESQLAIDIYEYYIKCGSTVKTGLKFGYSTNTINSLLSKMDPCWKKYGKRGRGHVFMFDEKIANQIYEEYKKCGRINYLANKYNVDRSTIVATLKRIDQNYFRFSKSTKFTEEEEQEIYSFYLLNPNIKFVAQKYHSSWATIAKVINKLN